ncbi:MAG: DUF1572 family protein [Vicingaceae bacterium]|nr:DUF1572 family protein [Vicingaceae bacterium]
MTKSLTQLFERDLEALKNEINSYSNENNLWITNSNINNSGGNLCLHLIGNLNHFIGDALGNTGYIRQRELEFSAKNIPVAEMSKQIDDVKGVVKQIISGLSQEDLNSAFPIEVFGHEMTTEFFLLHLSTHLNYHLGQINYHRRLTI